MADPIVCPDCGAENPPAKIKCHFCGRLLHEDLPDAVQENLPDASGIPEAPDARDQRGGRQLHVLRSGRSAELRIDTSNERVMDITDQVSTFVEGIGLSGLLSMFLQHATAGIAIMETGSGSEADLNQFLDRLIPADDRYVHEHGATGHGRDHLLPVFVSPSLTLPVDDGRLVLGTWQRIVVVDPNVDNNQRKVRLTFLGAAMER